MFQAVRIRFQQDYFITLHYLWVAVFCVYVCVRKDSMLPMEMALKYWISHFLADKTFAIVCLNKKIFLSLTSKNHIFCALHKDSIEHTYY